MTESIISSTKGNLLSANNALDFGVKSWFAIALIGQWAFAVYIFTIYVLTFLTSLEPQNFTPAPSFKKAQGLDLVLFFAHIVPAIYLSLFGMLQLVPKIRNRYRKFHRINGQIFFVIGLLGASTGLFLQWARETHGSAAASLGITLNGILIILAIFFAWRYAIQKRFDLHMRLAIHAFILVNGVWTFRLYLMGWYMVNQGPNGNTKNVDGPMDIFLSFACYLLPMAIVELYFWLKKQNQSNRIWIATAAVAFGAVVTLIGVVSAILAMWSPRISNVLNAI